MQLTYLTDDDSQWHRDTAYLMKTYSHREEKRAQRRNPNASLASDFFDGWKEQDRSSGDCKRWQLSARLVIALIKSRVTDESSIAWADITRQVATVEAAPTIVAVKIQWEWLKSLIVSTIPFTDLLNVLCEVLQPWMDGKDFDIQATIAHEAQVHSRPATPTPTLPSTQLNLTIPVTRPSTLTPTSLPMLQTTPPRPSSSKVRRRSSVTMPTSPTRSDVKRRSYIPIRVLCV